MRISYSLIWGQCTPSLRTNIKKVNIFNDILVEYDSLAIFKAIRKINFRVDSQKYKHQETHEAKRRFYLFKKDKTTSKSTYLEKFENTIKLIYIARESVGDSLPDKIRVEYFRLPCARDSRYNTTRARRRKSRNKIDIT